MIGNYGVADEGSSREAARARGARCAAARARTWTVWLAERGIVALDGIDTRALTRHLRDAGAMRGVVVARGRCRRGARAGRGAAVDGGPGAGAAS